jgi:hypothetical protein
MRIEETRYRLVVEATGFADDLDSSHSYHLPGESPSIGWR